jgi:predicted nucleic acid-binding protein
LIEVHRRKKQLIPETEGIMAPRVYVETTLVSYLTARPSRDVVMAGHQQSTHEWWDQSRADYELCTSQLVLQEAGAGNPEAAEERLQILRAMVLLDTTKEAVILAEELVRARALPEKAADDALHIAIAANQKIPYLLTWNCRHLANATMRPVIDAVCASKGYKAPIICTPEELRKEKP